MLAACMDVLLGCYPGMCLFIRKEQGDWCEQGGFFILQR